VRVCRATWHPECLLCPDRAPESLQSSGAQGFPFTFHKVNGVVAIENEEIVILSYDFQRVPSMLGYNLAAMAGIKTEVTLPVSVVCTGSAPAQWIIQITDRQN